MTYLFRDSSSSEPLLEFRETLASSVAFYPGGVAFPIKLLLPPTAESYLKEINIIACSL
jgi:hypothetical protein